MMEKELSQTELGRALGISQPMVSKLASQGMPTHSVEAAQQWRVQYLNPFRTKRAKRELWNTCVQITPPTGASAAGAAGAAAAQTAASLAQHLGELLEAGKSVSELLPAMRQALRAVPFEHRDEVPMAAALWRLLLAEHLEELTLPDSPGTPPMAEVEKEVTGWICYRLAAGERVPVFSGVRTGR